MLCTCVYIKCDVPIGCEDSMTSTITLGAGIDLILNRIEIIVSILRVTNWKKPLLMKLACPKE